MEIEFRFPYPIGTLYDPDTETAFIWGKEYGQKGLFCSISHETIHATLHKLEGEKTQRKFDSIATKVKRWNKEVYITLY